MQQIKTRKNREINFPESGKKKFAINIKRLSLIFLFVICITPITAWAQSYINIAGGNASGAGWSLSGGVLTISGNGNYVIYGTIVNGRVVVNTGLNNVNITLGDTRSTPPVSAVIGPPAASGNTNFSAMTIGSGSTVNLTLASGTNNTLKGGLTCAGLEVTQYATLNINGAADGKLNAIGGAANQNYGPGAGIGSNGNGIKTNYMSGTITINNGIINATGGSGEANPNTGGGAGIGGGGSNGSSGVSTFGVITINGGNITATGGNAALNQGQGGGGGAGIGGGGSGSNSSSGGDNNGSIIINAGTINTTGGTGYGCGGAGVGGGGAFSGINGGAGKIIEIEYGVNITANGGTSRTTSCPAADIGSGGQSCPPTSSVQIIRQPPSEIYVNNSGEIGDALTVIARIQPSGIAVYQWYKNTTNSNTGGTLIPGATSGTLQITESLEDGNKYFYYCVVTDVCGTAVSTSSIITTVKVGSQPVFTVTVSNAGADATGAGSYEEDKTVIIYAGAPPAGKRFKNWTTSDGVTFADANNAETTFTMPARNVTVTANYVDVYPVTVVSEGTGNRGSGEYEINETVGIVAGTPPEGKRFDRWTTTSAGVIFANASDPTTTFSMPANAVTVTAVFVDVYQVTVVSDGTDKSGDGFYDAGETVSIVAGTPPAGKRFKNWTTTSPGVAFENANNATTTFTMPANAVTVNANFVDVYTVTVVSAGTGNSGSGEYEAGETVSIIAGTPPAGKRFKNWTTTSPGVSLTNANSAAATFTMPPNAVTVTAVFVDVFTVTVSSAGTGKSGDGEYEAGEIVSINAGTPPAGQRFKNWTTTSPGVTLANASSATTTFAMPANAVTVTAVFENIYPVTVSSEGTGFSGDGVYTAGETVSIYAGTPPDGKHFKHWITSDGVTFANANNPTTTFIMPPRTVTVTAVFEKIFTVTVTSTGTGKSGDGVYEEDEIVSINAGTPPAGQRFKEWTTTSPGVIFENAENATTTFTMPANDVTITANFVGVYTVTVSSVGTGKSGDGVYEEGETVSIVAGTPPAGKRFQNWTAAGITLFDYTSPANSFIMPDNDVTVTAIFVDVFTVTVLNGGTGKSGDGEYEPGETVSITAGTPPAGTRFKNWTATGITLADNTSAANSFIMPANNVTLTAVFEPVYAVTVNGGTGKSGDGVYAQGEIVSINAGAPPTTGHRFKNWTTGDGVIFANANSPTTTFIMPAKAVTVTAEFEPIFTVVVNGGTDSSGDGVYAQGEIVSINAGAPPTTGHRFKNWTTGDGVIFANANSPTTTFTMPANDVTVTAEFEPIYTVTVVSAGTNPRGSGIYTPREIVSIDAGTPPAGQRFKKWTITSGGIILANANSAITTFTMPENDVTVEAEFEPIFTVTVIGETGSSGGGDYTPDEIVSIYAGAAPAGQRFKQWTVTSGGVTLANANNATTTFSMLENAVTVTAVFEAIYAVTVISTGTNPRGDGNYAAGEIVSIDAGTPPAGQRFKDWTVTSGGVTLANENKSTTTFIMQDEAVTVTANFVDIYKVTVVSEGTGSSGSGDYAAGETVTIAAGTHPAGYTFSHWTSDFAGVVFDNPNGQNTFFIMPEGEPMITVTAHFAPKYTVTVVNAGSGSFGNGDYSAGETVSIYAGTMSGNRFKNWTVTSGGVTLANANSATTTFTMPANAVTVTAVFEPIFTVTVIGGTGSSGSGVYTPGERVSIYAGTAPAGYRFKEWTIISGGITLANANNATTTFIMPGNAVTVTAVFEPIFSVTVNSDGTGKSGGGVYTPNEIVSIYAGTPPTAGQRFKEWTTSDGVIFGNPYNATTTFPMLSKNVSVTAVFEYFYAVTVESVYTDKSGDGDYAAGQTVSIKAGTPPLNMRFKNWTVESISTITLANANNANTTFTMPANAVKVIANFEQIYKVFVNARLDSSGDGDYAQGETVRINAGTTPPGQRFKRWTTTDGVIFANANNETTTFTMPGNAVTVTAEYVNIHPVVVESDGTGKSGDGIYETGEIVSIVAGTYPGHRFKEWTSVDVTFANEYLETATFTMPDRPVTVTAVFVPIYNVTVDSDYTDKNGDGDYEENDIVSIFAGTPPAGKRFDKWETLSPGVTLANANNITTTFTMPANAVTVTAKFVDIYKVTVMSGGAGFSGGGDYQAGETVSIVAGTAPAGKRFKNWTTSDGFAFTNPNNATTTFTMPPKNVTVIAKFVDVYRVTVLSAGTGKSGDGEYEAGEVVSIVAGTAPAGQRFKNWTTTTPGIILANANNPTTTFTMLARNVTVTANFVNVYSVTVTSAGTGSSGSGLYEAGETISIFAGEPPTSDKRFKNWTTITPGVILANANSATTTFTMPARNVTLTANFVDIFAVTVSSAGTGKSGDGKYEAGETVSIVAGTPPAGMRFDKWTTTDGVFFVNDNLATTTFIMTANAVTVTAEFVNIYTVTVVSAGTGKSGDGNYEENETVTIIAGDAPAGTRFKNWTITSGSVTLENANKSTTTFIMPDEPVMVKANFEAIYEVIVLSTGTGSGGSGFYAAGETVCIDAGTAIPGQNFTIWSVITSGITVNNANNPVTIFTMPAEPVTVRAIFNPKRLVKVVSAGIGSSGGGDYTEGEIVTVKAGTAPAGRRFKEWTVTLGTVTLADNTNATTTFVMPSEAVTVTAVFELLYEVIVDSEGTGKNGDGNYAYEDIVSINAGTTPAGKRFKGWTSESTNVIFANATSPATTFAMPAYPVTVTANFVFVYTVTFNLNYSGATGVPSPQTVDDGEKVSQPGDPLRGGYTFNGWFTNDGAGGNWGVQWNFDTDLVTGNTLLYAKWIAPLTGDVHIEGDNAIGEELKAVIENLNVPPESLHYEWYVDGVLVGTGDTYIITGNDAGKEIICVITSDDATGELTASLPTKVPFNIFLTKTGNVTGDYVSFNALSLPYLETTSTRGVTLDEIAIYYILGSSGSASINTLTFMVNGRAIAHVWDAKTGSCTYTVNPADAVAGVITITAKFVHNNKTDVTSKIIFNDGRETYNGNEHLFETAVISGITAGAHVVTTYIYEVANIPNNGNASLRNGYPFTAGTYTVIFIYEDDDNYGVAKATFIVDKVAITITAEDEVINYGESPMLKYNITSGALLTGETIVGALAVDNLIIGTHAITRGTLTAGNNYDITFIEGTLTVLSGNLDLSSVSVDGKPARRFNNNFQIVAECRSTQAQITLTVDPNAKVEIDGLEIVNPLNPQTVLLTKYGDNVFNIRVSILGSSQNYTVTIVRNYDQEKYVYADVPTINCNPLTNGGYTFTDFQWYREGVAMSDTDRPYFRISDNAKYYCEITTHDGNKFRTCDIQLQKGVKGSIKAYPNPTLGTVNIEIDEQLSNDKIQVFDLYGKLVLLPSTNPFDMSVLPEGVYMITVNGETVKVIVNK